MLAREEESAVCSSSSTPTMAACPLCEPWALMGLLLFQLPAPRTQTPQSCKTEPEHPVCSQKPSEFLLSRTTRVHWMEQRMNGGDGWGYSITTLTCNPKVKNWRATVVLPEVNGLPVSQVSSRCIRPSRSWRRKG